MKACDTEQTVKRRLTAQAPAGVALNSSGNICGANDDSSAESFLFLDAEGAFFVREVLKFWE